MSAVAPWIPGGLGTDAAMAFPLIGIILIGCKLLVLLVGELTARMQGQGSEDRHALLRC